MTTTIDISSITDGSIDGNGTFDLLAKSIGNHIAREYDAGRIVGADYSSVYLGAIQSALAQAMQFETTKAQAGFAADLTEEQVKTQINNTALVEAQTKVTLERGGFR